jgi:hypothetical protein
MLIETLGSLVFLPAKWNPLFNSSTLLFSSTRRPCSSSHWRVVSKALPVDNSIETSKKKLKKKDKSLEGDLKAITKVLLDTKQVLSDNEAQCTTLEHHNEKLSRALEDEKHASTWLLKQIDDL